MARLEWSSSQDILEIDSSIAIDMFHEVFVNFSRAFFNLRNSLDLQSFLLEKTDSDFSFSWVTAGGRSLTQTLRLVDNQWWFTARFDDLFLGSETALHTKAREATQALVLAFDVTRIEGTFT